MEFSIPCPCGKQVAVSDGMAGGSVSCECGRPVQVPSLRELHDSSGAPLHAEQTSDEATAQFQRMLAQQTPRVYVTFTIVGLCITVFVLMVATGVSPIAPSIKSLLQWGADYGPKTLHGQFWRLFTCMFIHIGVIHLLCNLWAFLSVGPLVERLVGNVSFLLVYLWSGLLGSLTSLYYEPNLVSAGASGAIFGVYGAFGAILLLRRSTIPSAVLTHLRSSTIAFVGYNLIYGFITPQVDVAAHLGGLVTGFGCGLALAQPLGVQAAAQRRYRNLLVGAGGALVVVGAFLVAPEKVELQTALMAFDPVEQKAVNTYNHEVNRVRRGDASEAELADVVAREVLPPWREGAARFHSLQGLPAQQQATLALFIKYVDARQRSWELLVESIREQNQAKARQAETQANLAQQYLDQLKKQSPGK